MNQNGNVGIACALLGMLYSVQAFNLPKANIGNPWAPIYFPLTLGILMTILGVVLIIKEYSHGRAEKKTKTARNQHYIKLIVGTVVLCLVYAFIFNSVGFKLSTLIFLGAILTLVNGPRAWKTNFIVTVGFTFGIWYAFEKVLMISLP